MVTGFFMILFFIMGPYIIGEFGNGIRWEVQSAPESCLKCGWAIDRSKDVCEGCGCSTAVSFSPLGLGFVGDRIVPFERNFVDDIYGIDLGLIGTGHRRVFGFQGASIYSGANEIYGISACPITLVGKLGENFKYGYSGCGLTAAGVYNDAADFTGVELAGLVNESYDSDFLMQGSGWANASKNSGVLLQFTGWGSTAHKTQVALQISGCGNRIMESAKVSVQAASFQNATMGSDFALQIGCLNCVRQSKFSWSAGGVLAIMEKTDFGLQTNIINSMGEKAKGIQIGLFNYMDDSKGLQIGLVNRTDKLILPVVNFVW